MCALFIYFKLLDENITPCSILNVSARVFIVKDFNYAIT